VRQEREPSKLKDLEGFVLEETELPLKDIAARTELGEPSTLWRVFGQYLGVTPAAYRERFAALAAS
jgi:AraC-like DNA-binding protein